MAATHLLVGNPTAQSGKNRERIDAAIGFFARLGITVDLLPTLPAGKTIGAVTQALDTGAYQVVIAMGGDGTFREVGAGLIASRNKERVAMAMLPTGTANDQGRSFGLDASAGALEENVQVIVTARETRLDAGSVSRGDSFDSLAPPDLFFDSAGWGLTARVLAQRNKDRAMVEHLGPLKELYRDHAVYLGSFVKTFLESYVVKDKFVVHAVLDGKSVRIDGLIDVIVKGTRVYAGSWVFDPTSKHDDGAFELVPFRGKRDWASKAIVDLEGNPITEAMLNQIGVEHSHPIRASKMDLTFELPDDGVPLAAQIDGEEWPSSNCVRVEVIPRAIRLIVP